MNFPENMSKLLGHDIPYFEDKGAKVAFNNTNGDSRLVMKPVDAHGNPIKFFTEYRCEAVRDFPAMVPPTDSDGLTEEGDYQDIIIPAGTQFTAQFKPNLELWVDDWYLSTEPLFQLDYKVIS